MQVTQARFAACELPATHVCSGCGERGERGRCNGPTGVGNTESQEVAGSGVARTCDSSIIGIKRIVLQTVSCGVSYRKLYLVAWSEGALMY